LGIFLFNSDQSFSTKYGEQLSIALPDGSEMILNAKSNAIFDQKNWDKNRLVTLEGEAFFKVKKGSKFTVTTKHGDVTVLGTQFNVQALHSFFEVKCFEGKVSVVNYKNKEILTAGKAYRNLDGYDPQRWIFEALEPSWITNTSSFRSIPLKYVFKELEEQYDITINSSSVDLSIIYTGTFPNNNQEIALNTVFSTLGINYSLSNDGKTVVLEK